MIDRRSFSILAFAVLIGVGAWWWLFSPTSRSPTNADMSDKPLVDVKLPVALSSLAQDGKVLFERNCATCHGANAAGSGNGPPLVHKIYEPSHHGDHSFLRAARVGVRQHHWNFGDMPAQADVRDVEVFAIVAYVRELQRANGIH